MALRQQLIQKLEQRLSPQQIQLMKLLQVPTMELDQRIKQELEENPALEEGQEIEVTQTMNKSLIKHKKIQKKMANERCINQD
jgi:DNA-directed RNA polymerase specialized sigma54-like protein